MTSSTRRTEALGAAFAAWLCATGAANAQGTLGAADIAPIPNEPVTVSPSESYESSGFGDDIGAASLEAPSVEAGGLVQAGALGLHEGMWADTDPATALRLVDAVQPTRFHSVNQLLRRAMVASARPPEGAAGLLAARAAALIRFGAAEEASSLASIGLANEDPALRRIAAEAALIVGRDEELCDSTTMGATQVSSSSDSFWSALRGYCLAQSGDPLAGVAIQAMRELGALEGSDAALLEALIDRSLTDYIPLPRPESLTPLRIAMLRSLGRAEGRLIDPAPLPMIAGLFALESTGARGALRSAERLERTGAIPTRTLRDLYVSLAKDVADTDLGPRAQAVSAAFNAPEARAIGEAMLAAARAEGVNGFSQLSRVVGPAVAKLAPSDAQGLGGLAYALRDAMLLSGFAAEAGIWADSQGRRTPIERADSAALMAIADPAWPGVWRRESGDALRERARGGDEHARRALAALAAFEFAPRPQLPDNDAMRAASAGRVAEAVFRVAEIVSDTHPLPAQSLDIALRALRLAGLSEDARRIATEIMITNRWM